MLDIFLRLVLDFIDEYLSILTDRNTELLPPETRFKGPEADIFHSLDQSNPEKITKESWMDFEDNLFVNLKKGKKTKTGRKGWGSCVQWNLLIVGTLGTSILCIV